MLNNSQDSRKSQSPVDQAPPEILAVPHVDIYEDENGITLLADMPGVTKEDLVARIDGESLIVEGSVKPLVGDQNMELVHGEARASNYRRQFLLSRELDTSRIDAKLRDGLLRLTIPKAEAAKPRRITITTD